MGRKQLDLAATPPGARWKWWVCALLLLASAVNYMDRMTLASVSRRVIDELRLSNSDYGMVEQYFGYAFAIGAVLFGAIVDRFNTKWLYPLILALWSAMGILTGFVGEEAQLAITSPLGWLLLCRTMLGLFEAGHWPCGLRTTQWLLAPQDRAFGNSILQSGTAIGATITPFIVAAMLTPEEGSWRRPFFWIGGAGLLWAAAWIWTMRGQTIGVAPAPESDNLSWSASIRLVLADHRFWLLAFVVASINSISSLYRVWLPLALQDKAGMAFSEAEALGRVLPLYYVVTDVGCIAAGAATVWLHRQGQTVLNSRRWVFTACSLLMLPASQLPALARAELHIPGLSPVAASMLVLLMTAAGSLGVFPCYYSFVQELSPRHLGLVTGLLAFVAWVVPASLQRPLGAYIDRTGSYDFVFQVGAWPVLISALLLWLFWDSHWPRRTSTARRPH